MEGAGMWALQTPTLSISARPCHSRPWGGAWLNVRGLPALCKRAGTLHGDLSLCVPSADSATVSPHRSHTRPFLCLFQYLWGFRAAQLPLSKGILSSSFHFPFSTLWRLTGQCSDPFAPQSASTWRLCVELTLPKVGSWEGLHQREEN